MPKLWRRWLSSAAMIVVGLSLVLGIGFLCFTVGSSRAFVRRL